MSSTDQAIPSAAAPGLPLHRSLVSRARGVIRSSELALAFIAAVVGGLIVGASLWAAHRLKRPQRSVPDTSSAWDWAPSQAAIWPARW